MIKYKKSMPWVLFVCLGTPLHAQTAQDAGSIFQQLEQSRPKLEPSGPALPVQSEPQKASSRSDEHHVVIKTFKFQNNTKLSSATLEAAVQPYLNHPIAFPELQNAAADVSNLYRQHGWLVHTLYPEQDITNGEVTMQVVEAQWGGVIIHNNTSRIPNLRISNTMENAIDQDTPLLFGIDRGLNLINELPGVSAEYSLQQGQAEQTIQTRLDVSAKPLMQTNISIDNQGSRSTGDTRFVGQLVLNSLNAWADQAILTTVNAQGMNYAHVSYSFPIGYQGFRLGLNTSDLQYKVIEDSLSAVQASGNFQTQGVEATYPLIRSTYKALNAFGTIEKKEFENQSNASITSQYNTRVLTLGLNGVFAAADAPSRSTDGSISVSSGTLQNTLSGTSQIHFEKLNYSLSHQRPLNNNWRLQTSLKGQYSQDALDSSEKFYLGGAQGVRAYPANEGGASNGRIVSLEATRSLHSHLTFTGFYDWGKLYVRSAEVFSTSGAYILKGIGLSLRWTPNEHLTFDATWAHRIGNNPNPTSVGSDQDGTRKENRLWLRGSLRF